MAVKLEVLYRIGAWLFPGHAVHAKLSPAYRRDIDGLRAIAVLSVLLFHLNDALLSGGYAGVDIFFVISGYLITQLIFREIAGGSFSVITFYERRARRIFPALTVTIACTFLAGLLIFMPDELRYLGAGATAAAVFSANILFWLQTDYFTGPAEYRPFLHTWSLAVEEQFYLIAPIAMLVI